MTQERATDDVAEVVRRARLSASALIAGDIRGYLELIEHAHDYTLMSPFGGNPVHGSDDSEHSLAATADFFQGGEAEVEVVSTYASGDLVVLVVIERQHGRVGGLPDQDLSLRVTMVFRRTASGWEQVHRHADPLVHGIDLEHVAGLLRG